MMTAVALCAAGAEKVLANELRKLRPPAAAECFRIADSGFGKVRFQTDLAGLYLSLMALRSADRVLLETGFFHAEDFDALFKGAAAVPWESYVPKGMGFRVSKVRVNRSRLSALTSIQAVVHKAAAERLCGRYRLERLPEQGADAEIRIYIEKDQVSLLLDLSGEPLFKRGYRTEGGPAPLRETTAASILLLSGWKRKFPLYDPYCGSGTILIEAAMYAWDMAPGLGRSFALEKLLIADRDVAEAVRRELGEKINFERNINIAGSDADARSTALAKSNVQRAYDLALGKEPVRGIRPVIRLPFLPDIRTLEAGNACPPSVRESPSPAENPGFIITNPPYGRRLDSVADAERNYAGMSGLLRRFPGWKLALITDHPGFESLFGEKASSCREITNGAIPAYFFQYDPV
jgi:putative N6-adenine-specific DNA methylase